MAETKWLPVFDTKHKMVLQARLHELCKKQAFFPALSPALALSLTSAQFLAPPTPTPIATPSPFCLSHTGENVVQPICFSSLTGFPPPPLLLSTYIGISLPTRPLSGKHRPVVEATLGQKLERREGMRALLPESHMVEVFLI